MDGAGGVGALLTVTNDSENYYPSYDGNSNIVNYVDENQTSVASFEYSPFGSMKNASGSMCEELHYRFSTKYFDNSTGLIVYRYRNYNPNTGKWLKRDPIAEKGGYNLYAFVNNNPVNYFDNLGLDELEIKVVSKRKNDKAEKMAHNYHDARYVTSFQDLIQYLKRKIGKFDNTGKNGNCIKKLILLGHGDPNKFYVGKDEFEFLALKKAPKTASKKQQVVFEQLRLNKYAKQIKFLKDLKKLFCCGEVNFEIRQCRVGNGKKGDEFGNSLSDELGVNIILHEGLTTYLGGAVPFNQWFFLPIFDDRIHKKKTFTHPKNKKKQSGLEHYGEGGSF